MLGLRNRVGNLVFKRQVHGNAEIVENCKEIINRNPRNLEHLRIARKFDGYFLEKPGLSYWHRLVVTKTQRYITAGIQHIEHGTVLSASSNEWGLKRQLYSTNDATAYISVGHTLAQRCFESGICQIYANKEIIISDKIKLLMNEMEKMGIDFNEPNRYEHPNPWSRYREEKPWETFE